MIRTAAMPASLGLPAFGFFLGAILHIERGIFKEVVNLEHSRFTLVDEPNGEQRCRQLPRFAGILSRQLDIDAVSEDRIAVGISDFPQAFEVAPDVRDRLPKYVGQPLEL
jgi:hypothetical protein